jgi:hypothetical protein
MSKATLLLIGPGLPYHVLDFAIAWAKDNESSLKALFLVPGNLPEEGYPFPNDLDSSENITTEVEAEKGIKDIIQQEIRFIEKRCKASHIPVATDAIYSPTLQQVLSNIDRSEIVIIDKNAEENEDDLKDLSFSVADIAKKTSVHFAYVGENDKYSDVF